MDSYNFQPLLRLASISAAHTSLVDCPKLIHCRHRRCESEVQWQLLWVTSGVKTVNTCREFEAKVFRGRALAFSRNHVILSSLLYSQQSFDLLTHIQVASQPSWREDRFACIRSCPAFRRITLAGYHLRIMFTKEITDIVRRRHSRPSWWRATVC